MTRNKFEGVELKIQVDRLHKPLYLGLTRASNAWPRETYSRLRTTTPPSILFPTLMVYNVKFHLYKRNNTIAQEVKNVEGEGKRKETGMKAGRETIQNKHHLRPGIP